MSVESLRGRAAFEAVRREGRRSRRGPLTMTVLLGGPTDPVRVGYVIGRRVGGAVTRNRVRRRLRAIVRSVKLAPGSYLIGAAPAAVTTSFAELDATLRRLLDDGTAP